MAANVPPPRLSAFRPCRPPFLASHHPPHPSLHASAVFLVHAAFLILPSFSPTPVLDLAPTTAKTPSTSPMQFSPSIVCRRCRLPLHPRSKQRSALGCSQRTRRHPMTTPDRPLHPRHRPRFASSRRVCVVHQPQHPLIPYPLRSRAVPIPPPPKLRGSYPTPAPSTSPSLPPSPVVRPSPLCARQLPSTHTRLPPSRSHVPMFPRPLPKRKPSLPLFLIGWLPPLLCLLFLLPHLPPPTTKSLTSRTPFHDPPRPPLFFHRTSHTPPPNYLPPLLHHHTIIVCLPAKSSLRSLLKLSEHPSHYLPPDYVSITHIPAFPIQLPFPFLYVRSFLVAGLQDVFLLAQPIVQAPLMRTVVALFTLTPKSSILRCYNYRPFGTDPRGISCMVLPTPGSVQPWATHDLAVEASSPLSASFDSATHYERSYPLSLVTHYYFFSRNTTLFSADHSIDIKVLPFGLYYGNPSPMQCACYSSELRLFSLQMAHPPTPPMMIIK